VSADPIDLFHLATRTWFSEALGAPTRAQNLAWPPIAEGATTLLTAPTGSGKTLAAFLAAIDRLMWTVEPPREARCRVLYVSPLKALAVDIEKNLRAPIAGIVEVARRLEVDVRVPVAFVRTGDTPPAERARMRRSPPDILITTPESLFLVLTSGARDILRSVETVIVDEIHSLVPNKRGAHLFLSLERLELLRGTGKPLQRIGLSATQRPLDEVARLLGGFAASPTTRGDPAPTMTARPVVIVDASAPKPLDIRVEAPAVDMSRLGDADRTPRSAAEPRRSIWPYLHEHIVPLVRAHRSTMIFVNSRRLAERLASALNDVAGEEIALAHHGSVAREQRAVIEDRLKRGDLKAIVATASLELGIDMGAVDLVIQVEPPPSVASGLQRIGRAGHSVSRVSRGIMLPKHRGDLLGCAAAVFRIRAGDVESTFHPKNPLDVLAQQIVAVASDGEIGEDDLFELVRRAAPFSELSRATFESVLDMLSGRYPADDFAGLRPRLTWDRTRRRLRAREGAKRIVIANGGTIPDRGLYGVFLGGQGDVDASKRGGRRVGELDEEMVFELREGEVFLLGASSWRTEKITADRVLVTPAAGEPGKMPFWHGDRGGRPLAFGLAIGELAREIAGEDPAAARARLASAHGMNESATANLLAYLSAQVEATGVVPSDRTLIIERTVDDLGDHRVCVLSPLGARVHAPWCTAVLTRLSTERVGAVEAVWSDDGMVFRIPEASEPPPPSWFLPPSADVERIVTSALGHSSLFASHFRECAGRALFLPRRRPGERTSLWAQRKRAADLLAVASAYPDFPILLETYRECLRDVFDMPGLVATLRRIESGDVRVVTVDSRTPSPFATSLLFSFVASFIYEGDAPLAERRAQALAIDHARLRELLGEVELRALLDPTVMAEHVRLLSRVEHPVRHADGLHDMLLSLGDLSASEIAARSAGPSADWVAELLLAQRVLEVRIAGDVRYAAIEDAGKLRDALGVALPRDIPDAFLTPRPDALGELLARFARTHGPFTVGEASARFGLDESVALGALEALVLRGKVACGEFQPGGHSTEYCDNEVLEALRRKSLARTRRAVEPVGSTAYARFLLDWQLPDRRGHGALLDAVRQLEGCPLLASSLETEILPARVPGYRPWDLDALSASGAVVWAGIEAVGASDGRIALYLAEHESLLARPSLSEVGPVATRIRELLSRRGAIFFSEIARELGGYAAELSAALWELVWAGEATNDTLEALRGRRGGGGGKEKGGAGRPPTVAESRTPLATRYGRRDEAWRASGLYEAPAGHPCPATPRDERPWPTRSSNVTGSSTATWSTQSPSPEDFRRSTVSSKPWRRRGACGAATSSRTEGRRSSRCRVPTIACARIETRPRARRRGCSRRPTLPIRTERSSRGRRRTPSARPVRRARADGRSGRRVRWSSSTTGGSSAGSAEPRRACSPGSARERKTSPASSRGLSRGSSTADGARSCGCGASTATSLVGARS
jgi:ATP-dependent helicase Lhr and Lhr-like helicase